MSALGCCGAVDLDDHRPDCISVLYRELEAENAKLRAALEWYASDAPYSDEECDRLNREGGFFPYDANSWAINDDLGKRAREALGIVGK